MADWLGGSAALAVLSFDVDAESVVLAEDPLHAANAMLMSHQAYGPEVGVPRILELLAEYGAPATFFVPGLTAELRPGVVERILEAGHEVGHHSFTHRSPVGQTEDEQRRELERGLAALARFGVKPAGYRAPSWEPSWRTAALVAEYGLSYDSSLAGDDRPYILETGSSELVELPVSWWLDDWQQTAYLPPLARNQTRSAREVLELWTGEVDAYARHGCLYVLTCHPFLSGRPGRVELLRGLIEHILSRGDVELQEARRVAERALADESLPRRKHQPLNVEPGLYAG
jgi:peptidoglycan/xylan/chitin deacetylase (PgdA/CDA1 family)